MIKLYQINKKNKSPTLLYASHQFLILPTSASWNMSLALITGDHFSYTSECLWEWHTNMNKN